MCSFHQPKLFDADDNEHDEVIPSNRMNFGTFKDSLRAPIHSWFTYPAGFSYKAVEEAFRLNGIVEGNLVYDPFAGTGTTNVVATQYGIDSIGVEAHPFVHFVAKTKLNWQFEIPSLLNEIDHLISRITYLVQTNDSNHLNLDEIFPELVLKCYSTEKLEHLYLCRLAIQEITSEPMRNFAKLALTHLLRSIADVATGWPYIAPQKAKKPSKTGQVDVCRSLKTQLLKMVHDLQTVRLSVDQLGHPHLIEGDARVEQPFPSACVDHAFTSPPYLNNYDYADRTRLEMYFWGEAQSWSDITSRVRTRLIMSATTQINRQNYAVQKLISNDLNTVAPLIAQELDDKVLQLSQIRLQKGGKKSYDILVAGYFNDMLCVLRETYRLLKPGASFMLILGDSAPYGVYVPTHTYLGEIGKGLGFSNYSVEVLRERGGKWKDNPQRHNVPLQECILTLKKA